MKIPLDSVVGTEAVGGIEGDQRENGFVGKGCRFGASGLEAVVEEGFLEIRVGVAPVAKSPEECAGG